MENFSRTKFLQNSFNGESITETAARFAETDQRTARVGDAFFCGAKSFRRQRLTLPRAGLRMARCMLRGDVSRVGACKAGVAELADALDSKSSILKRVCGFESLLRQSLVHPRQARRSRAAEILLSWFGMRAVRVPL